MKRCFLLFMIVATMAAPGADAQITETGLQYYAGNGMVPYPCLSAGDQIGVMFELHPGEYPVEVTGIDIGYGAMFHTLGSLTQEAIRIYPGAVPSGPPAFEWPAPVLTSGVLNAFNLDLGPGAVRVVSGPFVVALAIRTGAGGAQTVPTAVHDGYAPHPGHNLLFTPSTGWTDANHAGIPGDWVVRIRYRSMNGAIAAISPTQLSFTASLPIGVESTDLTISSVGTDTLRISGISGRLLGVATVDSTAMSHVVAPGSSTVLKVLVSEETSEAFNTSLRIFSNARNSPSVVFVKYVPLTLSSAGEHGPAAFEITSIVPNPFNPSTTINYTLPAAAVVNADIFSVDGRRIRNLEHGVSRSKGRQSLGWDGRDDRGNPAASGIYFVRLRAGTRVQTARLVLIK